MIAVEGTPICKAPHLAVHAHRLINLQHAADATPSSGMNGGKLAMMTCVDRYREMADPNTADFSTQDPVRYQAQAR